MWWGEECKERKGDKIREREKKNRESGREREERENFDKRKTGKWNYEYSGGHFKERR